MVTMALYLRGNYSDRVEIVIFQLPRTYTWGGGMGVAVTLRGVLVF